VLAEFGIRPDRDDAAFTRLLDALEGHPLAMRAVLLRLGQTPAAALLDELKAAFAGAEGDPATRRIYAPNDLAYLMSCCGCSRTQC